MNVVLSIPPGMTFADFRELAATEYLKVVLQRASGSTTRAAKFAGLNRTHLHEWLKRANLLSYAQGLRESAEVLKRGVYVFEPGASQPRGTYFASLEGDK